MTTNGKMRAGAALTALGAVWMVWAFNGDGETFGKRIVTGFVMTLAGLTTVIVAAVMHRKDAE